MKLFCDIKKALKNTNPHHTLRLWKKRGRTGKRCVLTSLSSCTRFLPTLSKTLLLPIILFGILPLKGQDMRFHGLEFYNIHMINPAFINAEKTVQLDLIGHTRFTNSSYNPKGYFANAIGNIDKINSSIRVSYEQESTNNSDFKSLVLGYAYKHTVSDQLKYSVGISINPLKYTQDEMRSSFDPAYVLEGYEHSGRNLDFGIGMQYKQLTVGISSQFNLSKETLLYQTSGIDSAIKGRTGFHRVNLFSQYELLIANKFSLIPQSNIIYSKAWDGSFSLEAQLGFLTSYKDLIGFGITAGSSLSFYVTSKIWNRLRLNLVLSDNLEPIYEYNSGWNLMGQVRFNF